MKNLTKGMCTDWARHGLQINAIGPGYFATPLNQALIDDPEFDAWLKNRTPAAPLGPGRGAGRRLHLPRVRRPPTSSTARSLYVDGGVLATL